MPKILLEEGQIWRNKNNHALDIIITHTYNANYADCIYPDGTTVSNTDEKIIKRDRYLHSTCKNWRVAAMSCEFGPPPPNEWINMSESEIASKILR